MHARSGIGSGVGLRARQYWAVLAMLLALPVSVSAHAGPGVGAGLLSGFLHPLTGYDHMLAMIAVGIWGSQLGQPAIWMLPVTFPLVMALGGVLGVRGVAIPGVELGIAASAVILGLMVLGARRPALAFAAALVGVFAIFHGYAHGVELPGAVNPLAYSAGFVLATGLLHATGITLALVERWKPGPVVLRAVGAGIAAVGSYLLVGLLR